jgi:hypothetical protein
MPDEPPATFESLPSSPSLPEILAAMARPMGRLESSLEDVRAQLVVVGAHASRADKATVTLSSRVDKQFSQLSTRVDVLLGRVNVLLTRVEAGPTIPALPPMRREMSSSYEFVAGGALVVGEELQKMASMTPGPGVGAEPEKIVELIERVFIEQARKRDALKAAQAERDELLARRAAEKEALDKAAADRQEVVDNAKKDKRLAKQRRLNAVAGLLGGLTLAAILTLSGFFWGRVTRAGAPPAAAPAAHS